jgi:apolipoprotein N-acyltransferase
MENGIYYDAFNASVAVTNNQPFKFYNKSKLVPGVETLPDFLIWLAAIFEKFGGTTGGYGKDKEASVFNAPGNPYTTAPIICYESIYGEYVASYVRKGANLLTIMTNDGWWANTPGHRQHLNYARLRAIETRRWIARSANTGISAVIDEAGNLKETRQWDETGAIKFNIPALTEQTFFVRNGDIISRVALFILAALLVFNNFSIVKKRYQKR